MISMHNILSLENREQIRALWAYKVSSFENCHKVNVKFFRSILHASKQLSTLLLL